jgi:DNA replication protein DnaC
MKICAKCNKAEVTSEKPGQTLCRHCYEKGQATEAWFKRQMDGSGMAPPEARAEWGLVSLGKLPEGVGVDQKKGLGLCGPTGCGKTFAMAALVKRLVWRNIEEAMSDWREDSIISPFQTILWESWPEAVGRLRSHGAIEKAEDWLQAWCSVHYLVLDDLGSERVKGSYAEDWASSFLDRLVDARYRYERPIFWTTNLDAAGLINLYGSRLVSRLMGPNPLVVMQGKDLRFSKGNQ